MTSCLSEGKMPQYRLDTCSPYSAASSLSILRAVPTEMHMSRPDIITSDWTAQTLKLQHKVMRERYVTKQWPDGTSYKNTRTYKYEGSSRFIVLHESNFMTHATFMIMNYRNLFILCCSYRAFSYNYYTNQFMRCLKYIHEPKHVGVS
jgi:hypothetical protein